ncbi:MAG: signal peptidase II [bacterium]
MFIKNFKFQSALLYGGILTLFLADRVFKIFFIKNPAAKRFFLFLSFALTKNNGIAFGLPVNNILLNAIVFLFIIILSMLFLNIMNVAEYVNAEGNIRRYAKVVIFLILLAAISNFIDRALYGAVIDYIELPYFVSLNIADIMITTGFFLIASNYILGKMKIK